jgi:hypothetical protein
MEPTNTKPPTDKHEPLQFPRLASEPAHSPWSPTLAGEGDFPEPPTCDPIEMAQRALDRMEAGMLKLHKAIDDDNNDDFPRRAA